MKSLLVILATLTAAIGVVTPIKTYVLGLKEAEYKENLGYIDVVGGKFAGKISYIFELNKICLKLKDKNLPEQFRQILYNQFFHFYKLKIQSRVNIEEHADLAKSKLGNELYDQYVKYFIQVDQNSIGIPQLYCSQPHIGWKKLKTKQRNFTHSARKRLRQMSNNYNLY